MPPPGPTASGTAAAVSSPITLRACATAGLSSTSSARLQPTRSALKRPFMPASSKAESAKNVRFVGYSDQGGRADGAQVMVNKGHAFVFHPFSGGVTIIDVRDPRAPKPVNFLPVHPRSWSIHGQAFGDLLL